MHKHTIHTTHVYTLINVRVCVSMCVRVCVCVWGGVGVCVLLSNKILKDALVIYFNIFLISTFFTKNTASLFETFMTISTINTKSGTNGILPHRIKRCITLDLQKQKI